MVAGVAQRAQGNHASCMLRRAAPSARSTLAPGALATAYPPPPHLEDHAVLRLAPRGLLQLGVADAADLHLAGADIHDAAVARRARARKGARLARGQEVAAPRAVDVARAARAASVARAGRHAQGAGGGESSAHRRASGAARKHGEGCTRICQQDTRLRSRHTSACGQPVAGKFFPFCDFQLTFDSASSFALLRSRSTRRGRLVYTHTHTPGSSLLVLKRGRLGTGSRQSRFVSS